MLVIRNEQLRALAEDADQRFFSGLATWARDAYWEQMTGKSAEQVEVEVREIASRALGYGIRGIDDVREFVALEYSRGPEFESKMPFAASILEDPAMPGRAKMPLLKQRMGAGR